MDPHKSNLEALPRRDNHHCFGCGSANPSGLGMTFYTDHKSVYSWVTIPPHLCGWNNIAHGGVTATILDEIMSWSAISLLKRLILTKSISVDFLKPIPAGTQLKAQGQVLERTNEREALMAGFVYDAGEELCAQATGKFALFTLDAIREKGILDPEILASFENILTTSK